MLLRLVLWTVAVGVWLAVLVLLVASVAVMADLSAADTVDRGVEWGAAALQGGVAR